MPGRSSAGSAWAPGNGEIGRREMGVGAEGPLSGARLELVFGKDAEVAEDPRGPLLLVLYGQVHGGGDDGGAHRLLERYRRSGPASLGEVPGSYAVFVSDGRSGDFFVVTDRVNSRRVFTARAEGIHWLATARMLERIRLPELRPDPVGVAHYLANGLPYHGRTPFREISVLEPGAVHTLTPHGFRGCRYWSPLLTETWCQVPEARLRRELYERLLAAVERRTAGEPRTCLALSGGWDSSVILGAAHELGIRSLECVSYGDDRWEQGRSDALVARNMARSLGYEHVVVRGFGEDLVSVIRDNARSLGTVQLVMETDAWRTLRTRIGGSSDETPPPLLLGDHGAGVKWKPLAVSPREVLGTLRIRGFEALSWLRGILPPDRYDALDDALDRDLQELVDRIPRISDPEDLRYWLYMDQYIARLVGWREFFASPEARPRFPLLDHGVLDLARGVPREARRNKRLLKETAAEWFPEVFSHERATSSGGPSITEWCRARLEDDREAARQLLESGSPLDEYLPPRVLKKLVDGDAPSGRGRRGLERLHELSRGWLARTNMGVKLGRGLGMGKQRLTIRPALFLVRALYLRYILADGAERMVESTNPTGAFDG